MFYALAALNEYDIKHKEVMDLIVYAEAAYPAPKTSALKAIKKNIMDSLILLDSQYDRILASQGQAYVNQRLNTYKGMIESGSKIAWEMVQVQMAISTYWYNPGKILISGLGYDVRWAGQQVSNLLSQSLKNAFKNVPGLSPETPLVPPEVWQKIKWPLIIGGGSLVLLIFLSYGMPMLSKSKKGGKR